MRPKFILLLAFFLATLFIGPVWAFQPIAMLPNLSSLSLEVISQSPLLKDQQKGLHLFYISKNPFQINYFSSSDSGINWQEQAPLKLSASQEVSILKSQIDTDNQIFLAYKEKTNSLTIQTLDPKKFNPSLYQTIKTTSPIDKFEITLHENYLKIWVLSNQELTLIKVDKRTLREEKRQIISLALTDFMLCQQDNNIYIFGKADDHKTIKITYNLLLSKISEKQEIFAPSEEIISLAMGIYLGQPVHLVLARNQGTYQIKNLKDNCLLIENREPIFEFSLKSMGQNLIMFVTSSENNNRIANAYVVSNSGNVIKKISFSSFGPFLSALILDQTPPEITLSENYDNREYENEKLTVSGKINEPISQLKIKGKNIYPIQDTFTTTLSLEVGENLIPIEAWDTKGNFSQKNLHVSCWPQKPMLTCLSPSPETWVKADSAIYAEWAVTDFQNDVVAQTPAEIYIDNQSAEAFAIFDKEENKIKGFITIPDNLSEGKHMIKTKIQDKEQNTGELSYLINIDKQPPQLNTNKIFINQSQNIILPAIDLQSGLDLRTCQLKIKGAQLKNNEAQLKLQKDGSLTLAQNLLLKEATYEAQLSLSDKAGNPLTCQSLEVVVDYTAPTIVRYNPQNNLQTEKPEIIFEGIISEPYLANAQFTINSQQKIPLQLQKTQYFSQPVPLFKEENIIEISATDYAGNTTSQIVNIKSSGIKTSAANADNFYYGPSPFNPSKNEVCYFKFDLASNTMVKMLIYSLDGELIRKTEENLSGFASIFWDGKDHNSQIMDNGVYQYYIIAGSLKKKGKIILLK